MEEGIMEEWKDGRFKLKPLTADRQLITADFRLPTSFFRLPTFALCLTPDALSYHPDKLFFRDNFYAKLGGFFEFCRAHIITSYDVISF